MNSFLYVTQLVCVKPKIPMKPFYLEDCDKFNKFKKEPFAFTFITFAIAPIVQSPSSSSLKASQAQAANYYESMSNQTINMSVFVGKSCQCILVRMVTPVELWSREEGRMEDFYKMKDKIQYHFIGILGFTQTDWVTYRNEFIMDGVQYA